MSHCFDVPVDCWLSLHFANQPKILHHFRHIVNILSTVVSYYARFLNILLLFIIYEQLWYIVLTLYEQHASINYMIEQTLKQLGFSEKQTRIYLTILQNGRLTPAEVAKITHINRSTVYNIAKELTAKGVVAEDLGSDALYLVAKTASDLDILARRDEKELEKKKELIDTAIKELKNVEQNSEYSIPKIVFVPEEDLENHLYKQSPIWNDSIGQYDNTWWGFQDRDFVRYYEDWIDWYWEQCAPKTTSLKLLSNETAEQIKKKKYTRRQIKFWENTDDFTATTWINGDYVIMIMTHKRPHYLVEIHDAVLAQNNRQLFKAIWKMVK